MSVTMPFFPYYGVKWRAWRHYPPPVYEKIIEPFAGAANYAARYAEKQVALYDSNPVIAGLWDYLIHVKESEIRALPLVGNEDDVRDFTTISQEARWLIGFWIQHGNAYPCNRPSTWFKAGERANSYWGEVVRERLALQLRYTRHWKIHHDYCAAAKNEEATWFIDPPYQATGSHYPESSQNIAYDELGRWCRGREGQVIVCEQDGADWLSFRFLAEIKTMNGVGRRGKSREAIWTKGCGLFDQPVVEELA